MHAGQARKARYSGPGRKRLLHVIAGAGIFGITLARRIAEDLRQPALLVERRGHIGGNCHSRFDAQTGIECHRYGSHIFHTRNEAVARFISRFTELTPYRHKVLTRHNGKTYPMPINLMTINMLYGRDFTPEEARALLTRESAAEGIKNPANLEEKAVSLIGRKLYEAFIRDYTKKQWNRDPVDLPAAIINRLPVRFNYDQAYFGDPWQGVPRAGYDAMFQAMADHPLITLRLNCDFRDIRSELPEDARLIYTGMPDELYDYKFGPLAWRSLRFEWETAPVADFQGTAVMNYADRDTAFTRIHEFKHYHPERIAPYELNKTVICREYPAEYNPGGEAYYPLNDAENQELHGRYAALAQEDGIELGGRLGAYKYWDMDAAAAAAFELAEKLKANGAAQ